MVKTSAPWVTPERDVLAESWTLRGAGYCRSRDAGRYTAANALSRQLALSVHCAGLDGIPLDIWARCAAAIVLAATSVSLIIVKLQCTAECANRDRLLDNAVLPLQKETCRRVEYLRTVSCQR